jgi:hypothetical protein
MDTINLLVYLEAWVSIYCLNWGSVISAVYVQIRIDHKSGTVHFGGLDLESDRLRDNVSQLGFRLAKALTMLNPKPSTSKEEFKAKVCDCYGTPPSCS